MVVLLALGDIVAEDGDDDGVEDKQSDEVGEDAEEELPSADSGYGACIGERVGVDEQVEGQEQLVAEISGGCCPRCADAQAYGPDEPDEDEQADDP